MSFKNSVIMIKMRWSHHNVFTCPWYAYDINKSVTLHNGQGKERYCLAYTIFFVICRKTN